MKKLFYALLIILVTNSLITPNCFSQDITVNLSEAESVLNNYFRYLRAGDTIGILNLLTGSFLKRRERLLKYNTEYPAFLRKKYEYAQFSIIGHRFIDDRKLALDVQIHLNDQEKLISRFVFVEDEGLLKISSEEDIPMSNQADGNS